MFVELNITPTKLKQKPRNIPIYRKTNWETMKTELNTLYNDLSDKVNRCMDRLQNQTRKFRETKYSIKKIRNKNQNTMNNV